MGTAKVLLILELFLTMKATSRQRPDYCNCRLATTLAHGDYEYCYDRGCSRDTNLSCNDGVFELFCGCNCPLVLLIILLMGSVTLLVILLLIVIFTLLVRNLLAFMLIPLGLPATRTSCDFWARGCPRQNRTFFAFFETQSRNTEVQQSDSLLCLVYEIDVCHSFILF